MNQETEYSGLFNYGNFCYVNSVIQSLFLSPSIINGLVSSSEHKKDIELLELLDKINTIEDLESDECKKHNMSIEKIKFLKIYFNFKQIIIKLMNKNESVVEPKNFIIECHKVRQDELFSGVQNDAQEFLHFLLDKINEAKGIITKLDTQFTTLNECKTLEDKLIFISEKNLQEHYTKNNYSWVVEKLFYQIITVMKCNNCPHHSLKCEPYRELALEIPSNNQQQILSIYDCLDNFFGKELFEKGEEWICEKCTNKEANFKQYRIIDFPDTLIIFFKRYKSLDMTGTRIKKINNKIEFPFILNMNKYKLLNSDINCKYNLYSVINQIGTFNSGHYFTYSRNLNSETDNNWYEFNDTNVSKIADDEIISSNAYILFYQKQTKFCNLNRFSINIYAKNIIFNNF